MKPLYYHRPLKFLLSKYHPFLRCPCIALEVDAMFLPKETKLNLFELLSIHKKIHSWRTALLDSEDAFMSWFHAFWIRWSYRKPRDIQKFVFCRLRQRAKKIAIWESFLRKTPYAIGGTVGWKMYCYFSKYS